MQYVARIKGQMLERSERGKVMGLSITLFFFLIGIAIIKQMFLVFLSLFHIFKPNVSCGGSLHYLLFFLWL